MIKLKSREKHAMGIMLSPMIDMMFLLLIFFIVSTMYMSELRIVPVKLPVASQSQMQSAAKFNVTIREEGIYWLGDQVIAEKELIRRAREENKRDEKFAAIIRAEENVPYRAVIRLLDELKKAWVSWVGLATNKEPKS